MSNIIQYTEEMLCHWAQWSVRYQDCGIGYPSRSIEKKLQDNGGVIHQQTGPIPLKVDELAEKAENLLREMATTYDKALPEAIRREYIDAGSQQYKAKCMGVSLSQFKVYLNLGKAWLYGRLSFNISNKDSRTKLNINFLGKYKLIPSASPRV